MQKPFFVPCAGLICFGTVAALLAAGCGGGSSSSGATSGESTTGRAVFRIAWPAKEATRLIPQASQSVQIQVIDGDKVLSRRIVPRPTDAGFSVVEISDLPAKKLRDVVTAYPTAIASGVAQAEGEAEVEIKADKTIDVPLTLQSAIDRIDLSPSTELTLAPGQTQTYMATPRNSAGEQVLVAPGGLQWKTDALQIVSIDQNGVATVLREGRATVTVTEPESGKSASVVLSSFGDPCSNAAPNNKTSPYLEFRDIPANVAVGDTVTFTFVLHNDALPFPLNTSANYAYVDVPGDTVEVARISPDPYAPQGATNHVYLGTAGTGDTVYSISYRQTDDAKNTCRISVLKANLDLTPRKGEYFISSGFRVPAP